VCSQHMGYFKAERTLLHACQSIFAGMEPTRLRITTDSGRSKLCHYICHELQFSRKLLQKLNQGCSTDSDKDRAAMLRFVRSCIVFEVQKFSAHRLTPSSEHQTLVDRRGRLIQAMKGYPSHLEVVLSTRDLRTRHALKTRTTYSTKQP